jgi:hypothetical protein
MSFRAPPERHWRIYGDDPLSSGAEALAEPLAVFNVDGSTISRLGGGV